MHGRPRGEARILQEAGYAAKGEGSRTVGVAVEVAVEVEGRG